MAEGKAELSTPDNERMLQNVLLSMPVAVAWADPQTGVITYINRKFTRMFGYEIEDLSTIHEWVMGCYANPEQAEEIDSFWAKGLNAGRAVDTELEGVELEIRCSDGSIKTVLSGKIVLPNKAGALSTFLDITPRKKRELLIRKQAMEDPLTGLLNKRVFQELLVETLDQSAATATGMALLLIDLDGFKSVNDEYGHDLGDGLLALVADRLREVVRDRDVLCRIGGDEFGVILSDLYNEERAEAIAERILDELKCRPYILGENQFTVGASIGIALYPENGGTEDELFKYADTALYRAKHAGKCRWYR